MSGSVDRIKAYYDRSARAELERLTRHRLEFEVTRRILRRHLTPRSDVADIGGGPGTYSRYLTELGHSVTLVDISPECVALATAEADKSGLRIHRTEVGDARDLSFLPSESFDAVLCLGPLYHLDFQTEGARALQECLRILRRGGFAFLAFISKYGPITGTAKMRPEAILRLAPTLRKPVETGRQVVTEPDAGWTDAFFVDPLQIDSMMEGFPLKGCGIYGLEGMVAQSEFRIYELGEAVTQAWADFIYDTGQELSVVASSEHILYVGQK